MVNPNQSWTKEPLKQTFLDRLELEIESHRGLKLSNIDLVRPKYACILPNGLILIHIIFLFKSFQVFFPICNSNHFYVICINLRFHRVVILDNSSAADEGDISVKYGEIPQNLVMCIS